MATYGRNQICPQCGKKRKRCPCARKFRTNLVRLCLAVGIVAFIIGHYWHP